MEEKTVEELRVPLENSYRTEESLDQHESYGMISMCTNQCGGKGVSLFGSSIKHGTFISVKIKTAERTRDIYGGHYMPKETIAEVWISSAQFTGMLTQMNTSGVPCSIRYSEKHGGREMPPSHDVHQEMFQDLKDKYNELSRKVKSLQVGVEKDLKGAVSKESKERIKFNINSVYSDLHSNLEFLQQQQTKRLERVSTELISEAEACINSLIYDRGLASLQVEVSKLNKFKEIDNE